MTGLPALRHHKQHGIEIGPLDGAEKGPQRRLQHRGAEEWSNPGLSTPGQMIIQPEFQAVAPENIGTVGPVARHGGKAGALTKGAQLFPGEEPLMARHIKTRPVGAKKAGVQRRGGDAHQENAPWFERPDSRLQGRERVRNVFKHIPQGDNIKGAGRDRRFSQNIVMNE